MSSHLLDRLVKKRQGTLRNALPDALDLLVVCSEAGLGLNSALIRLVREIGQLHPDLASEFSKVNSEIQGGMDREAALNNMIYRTGLGELTALVRVINQTMKAAHFKGVPWVMEFEPTVASIQRLRMQAQANAEEPNFQVKTDSGDLKFYFGDHSTHAGNFVFQAGVTGQLKRAWSYPVLPVMNIMALTGDKTMRISDDGAAKITVDSGLAVYNYILPAQSK